MANGREWSDLTKALRRAPWDNDLGDLREKEGSKSGLISYLETFSSELAFRNVISRITSPRISMEIPWMERIV